METIVLKTSPDQPDEAVIAQAAQVIKEGGLVGMPTETVYGLAADATNPQAVKKIFEAKGRPQDNPLIVHIADVEDVSRFGRDISKEARALMEAFWPGPMTIILKKTDLVPDIVSCGLDTVGIRLPSNPIARAFIRATGTGIAAPSANTSGRPSTTSAAHVYEDLKGKIPCIIDGGDCTIGVESTVIDMSGDRPTLLRPGGLPLEDIQKIVPEVQVDKCIYAPVAGDKKVRSPGMKYKHYAPKAPVTILQGEDSAIVDYLRRELNQAKPVEKIGILCYSEYAEEWKQYENAQVLELGSKDSVEDMAHRLFARLRDFDQLDVSRIYANCPEAQGLGLAVVNRLSKAAGFHIITLG